jgi:hypothetical protein
LLSQFWIYGFISYKHSLLRGFLDESGDDEVSTFVCFMRLGGGVFISISSSSETKQIGSPQSSSSDIRLIGATCTATLAIVEDTITVEDTNDTTRVLGYVRAPFLSQVARTRL